MTDQQQRVLAICLGLTGDRYYGRAVRECEYESCPYEINTPDTPCPECNGAGEVFREWVVCPECSGDRFLTEQDYYENYHCPKCEGSGHIPDEAGRDVIAKAIHSQVGQMSRANPWAGLITQLVVEDGDNVDVPDYAPYDPLRLWDNRHNQPWQSALEFHVRTYRKPLPDLKANRGEKLKKLLRESGISWQVYDYIEGFEGFVWIDREEFIGDEETEADALYKAVEAAILNDSVRKSISKPGVIENVIDRIQNDKIVD